MTQKHQTQKIGHARSSEQKSTWYSPVSQIYYSARPPYPTQYVQRAADLAQLSPRSSVLEIGCGPGNATVVFAQTGCTITCLDPNQEFCELARTHCAAFPKVKIHKTAFEEWQPDSARTYDAVISANAFHWIAPDIKYAKASEVLNSEGCLVLLWNLTPEPEYDVYQRLEEVYAVHAPSLVRYEGTAMQTEIIEKFSREVASSGYFKKPVVEQIMCNVTYNIDDYLNLLSTLRRLEPASKESLFSALRERLSEPVKLSFLSAIQVAYKK